MFSSSAINLNDVNLSQFLTVLHTNFFVLDTSLKRPFWKQKVGCSKPSRVFNFNLNKWKVKSNVAWSVKFKYSCQDSAQGQWTDSASFTDSDSGLFIYVSDKDGDYDALY